METRAYVMYYTWWSMFLMEDLVDKFIWTGRLQYKTVNGVLTIYVERQVTFLGIPMCLRWEPDDRFKFYEVEVAIVECSNGN